MAARPRSRADLKLVALAIVLGAGAFLVAPLFRTTLLALAFAALILAPMPKGTRLLIFAVMVGLATGTTAISSFAVSIFQAPITREFGWRQTQYSSVLTIAAMVLVVASPFAGRIFDSYSVRRLVLISTAVLGMLLISLHWLTNHLWHFYLVFCLMQGLGIGTSSIPYSRIITRWFVARRGQAFGTALAGVGIGGAVVSMLSQLLIGWVGWRDAYVGLGLLLLCVTLPVLWLWLHDAPEDVGLGPDGAPLAGAAAIAEHLAVLPIGLTAAQSRRRTRFWQMLLAFFIMAIGTGGVMLQLFPILRSHGISPGQAAAMQGALGLALIGGRAFAGFLMDRIFAPYVAAVVVLFPLVGTALLATGAIGWQATCAAMCLGLAAGGEVDIIAYLTTRYFGTRAYSENYGWLYAAWALGAGSAPLFTAMSIDRLGSYTPVLWIYVATFAVASVMLATLGRYPALETFASTSSASSCTQL